MTDPNQEVTGAHAADQSPTPEAPAPVLPDTAGEHEAQSDPSPAPSSAAASSPAGAAGRAAPTPQVPSLGRIVIVREAGKKDAPGIIAELSEDETEHEQTITCNVFRGDHIPHVASRLTQIDAKSTGTGWFFPPRV